MLLKTDDLGIPRFSNRDLIDMIYSGNVEKCHVVLCDQNDDVDKFNTAMEAQGLDPLQKYIPLDVDEKTFDGVCQSEWFMPDEYKAISVYEYVLGKAETPCPKHVQDRIWEELDEFKKRGMHDLLRYMIYLVDFMRENDIVWGVGRGSSVASYVLYLIGVHRIDSIKYDLDWREFLR
jgi:DNA polymerase III alpha subunit